MSGSDRDRPESDVEHWLRKFRDAGSGMLLGVRTESSLRVHLGFAGVTIAVSAWLQIEPWRWATILLCIAIVLAGEYFNSSIEQFVRVLHPEHDQGVANVLHLAAAGVLVLAIGSVFVGLVVLGPPLLLVFVG